MNHTAEERRAMSSAMILMGLMAFIYMGALSAALEGWTLSFHILSGTGMTVMVGATIHNCLNLFTEE
jgi:hypothetical protein